MGIKVPRKKIKRIRLALDRFNHQQGAKEGLGGIEYLG